MKAIAVILAAAIVAGCSGMRSSGGSDASGASGDSSYQHWQYDGTSGINRHDDSRDLYFGG